MARPYVAKPKGHLTKEQLAEREEMNDKMKTFTPLSRRAPLWFNDDERKEYRRILPLLNELPASALDQAAVENHCQLVAEIKRCSKAINEQGLVIDNGQGGTKKNPYEDLRAKAIQQLRATDSQLGLTPVSRLKLIAEDQKKDDEPKDPFSELLR